MNKTDLLSRGHLRTTLDTAVIVIPVEARLSDIQQFIEEAFDEFQFGDAQDDLQVRATLRPGVKISVDTDSLSFDIPMDLDIVQRTLLGKIRADGAIRLLMKSRYNIDENWMVSTSTKVEEYEWIVRPKANMSVITLSIESLSNRLIENNKEQLALNIDKQIANSINLKKSINDIWYRLRAPMQVSEEYKVWLQMKPIALSVSRLGQIGEKVIGYIKAQTSPRVVVGDRPVDFELDSIPKFEWLSTDTTGYLIPVKMTVPDQEIVDIANRYLSNETFDLGKKKVNVNDVRIQRSEDRWLVDMTLSGDVTGGIRMKGKPFWNSKKELVELRDFEYEVDSRNLLLKSSAVLFKQKVERRLVDQLNEIIIDRKNEMIAALKDQLLETNQNQWLHLANKIDRFTIYELGLDDAGMWVYVLLSGELDARFKYRTKSK